MNASVEIPFRVRFSWGLGSLGTISYLNVVTALVLILGYTLLQLAMKVSRDNREKHGAGF